MIGSKAYDLNCVFCFGVLMWNNVPVAPKKKSLAQSTPIEYLDFEKKILNYKCTSCFTLKLHNNQLVIIF